MNKPLRIIDEYHNHPRPGCMVPAWSREQGGYFIQVPPIQPNDEEAVIESRWSLEYVCSAMGVTETMIQHLKSHERENEEMYLNWIKNNSPYHIGVDFTSRTDETAFRKVDPDEHSTGQYQGGHGPGEGSNRGRNRA